MKISKFQHNISFLGIMADDMVKNICDTTTQEELHDILKAYIEEHNEDIFCFNRDYYFIFGRRSDFGIDENEEFFAEHSL